MPVSTKFEQKTTRVFHVDVVTTISAQTNKATRTSCLTGREDTHTHIRLVVDDRVQTYQRKGYFMMFVHLVM